jgi:acetyl-CoA C-acetyltransferase
MLRPGILWPKRPSSSKGKRIMPEAYIVAAARTAGGRRNGRLSGWHPADLAAQVLDALVARSGADPALVEDVIMGCVGQVGEQAMNIARNAVLASKLPETVPGGAIDRQCGSSQQALHFAAQAVMSGTHGLRDRRRRREHDAGADGLPSRAALQGRRRPGPFYMSPAIRKRYPGPRSSASSPAPR